MRPFWRLAGAARRVNQRHAPPLIAATISDLPRTRPAMACNSRSPCLPSPASANRLVSSPAVEILRGTVKSDWFTGFEIAACGGPPFPDRWPRNISLPTSFNSPTPVSPQESKGACREHPHLRRPTRVSQKRTSANSNVDHSRCSACPSASPPSKCTSAKRRSA